MQDQVLESNEFYATLIMAYKAQCPPPSNQTHSHSLRAKY